MEDVIPITLFCDRILHVLLIGHCPVYSDSEIFRMRIETQLTIPDLALKLSIRYSVGKMEIYVSVLF